MMESPHSATRPYPSGLVRKADRCRDERQRSASRKSFNLDGGLHFGLAEREHLSGSKLTVGSYGAQRKDKVQLASFRVSGRILCGKASNSMLHIFEAPFG
jgi:hypothetical protein